MAELTAFTPSGLYELFEADLANVTITGISLDGPEAYVALSNGNMLVLEGTELAATGAMPTGGTFTKVTIYNGSNLKKAEISNFGSVSFANLETNALRVLFDTGPNTITGHDGADSITGGGGNDLFLLPANLAAVRGDGVDAGGGTDTIRLAAVDPLAGPQSVGAHYLDGGAGNDDVLKIGNEHGSSGQVQMFGATIIGIEQIVFETGSTLLLDTASLGTGNVTPLFTLSGAGSFQVKQLAGQAVDLSSMGFIAPISVLVMGSLGNDLQTGTGASGGDDLRGDGGNDTLRGLAEDDSLSGDAGNDLLDGGAGADRLSGGKGNDVFVVDSRDDSLSDSGGRDTVRTAVSLVLAGGFENAVATATGRIDLTGNAAANQLTGNSGINWLAGRAGADRLLGAGGDDHLSGGAGNDRLTGGGGRDVFVFARNGDKDRVLDFDAMGKGDRLDLTGLNTIADFADLKAHHMKQVGANVVINALNGDVITLVGVKLADLGAADFIF